LNTLPLFRLASSDFPSVSINGRLFILELKQFHNSQSIFKRNGFLVDSLYFSYVTAGLHWLTFV